MDLPKIFSAAEKELDERYASKAQQRFFHAKLPQHAKKWDEETKAAGGFKKLPEKAKKGKK